MFARLTTILLIVAAVTPAQGQPSHFDIASCTMECCGYGTWRAHTRVVAFAQRDTTSPPAFVIQPNDTIVADSGIVTMLQPGVLSSLRTQRIRVQAYPQAQQWRMITVWAGDTLYTLFEDAEATDAVIWYRGSQYWTAPDFGGFTQLSALRSRWWAAVKDKGGDVGWVADPGQSFDGPGDCR